MKYCVGDIVVVRDDLVEYKPYGDIVYVGSQRPWKGKEVEIAFIGETPTGKQYYNIVDGADWKWTDDMFTGLAIVNDDSLDEFDWSGLCLT